MAAHISVLKNHKRDQQSDEAWPGPDQSADQFLLRSQAGLWFAGRLVRVRVVFNQAGPQAADPVTSLQNSPVPYMVTATAYMLSPAPKHVTWLVVADSEHRHWLDTKFTWTETIWLDDINLSGRSQSMMTQQVFGAPPPAGRHCGSRFQVDTKAPHSGSNKPWSRLFNSSAPKRFVYSFSLH